MQISEWYITEYELWFLGCSRALIAVAVSLPCDCCQLKWWRNSLYTTTNNFGLTINKIAETNTILSIYGRNSFLLSKLFWPTVRKNCSSDRENFMKFDAEGREFAKLLRSLEQFVWTKVWFIWLCFFPLKRLLYCNQLALQEKTGTLEL